MPDLLGIASGMKDVNYITPRVGMTPGGFPSAGLTDDSADNLARRQAMTENLFKTRYNEDSNEGLLVRSGKFLAAAGVDMADMVGGSLVPGVDRGDIWAGARDLGMNRLADFADRNKSGVQLTSGLVAAVVTAGVAEAVILPALGSRLAASTMLSNTRLFQAGKRYLDGAKLLATDSAMSAAVAGEAATVLGTAGGRALLRARMAGGAASAVGQEAAVWAVTRSNQELWSDDASTNLAMMALGVGIGGALGGLGARFEMRQIANSDEVQRMRSIASDPYGHTAIRMFEPDQADVTALGKGAEFKESVNTTNLMLQARQIAPKDMPANRRALIEQEAKLVEGQAFESLQKITVRGIEGTEGTGFSLNAHKTKQAGDSLKQLLHADPTALLGVDSLGLGSLETIANARKAHIESLRSSQDVADFRLARDLERQELLGLVNGSFMPDSPSLRQVSAFDPSSVKAQKIGKIGGTFDYRLDLSKGRVAKLGDNAQLMAQGRRFEQLDIGDQLAVYEGMNQMAKEMRRQNHTFILPENPAWHQIDFALEYEKRGGKVDLTRAGLASSDEARIASLRLKAEAAKAMNPDGTLDLWDRARLNLPLPGSLERLHDGTSGALSTLLDAVRKNPKMTVAEAQEIRQKLLQASDLRDGIKQDLPAIDGGMFSFNRTESGEWKPIVAGYASYNRVIPEMLGSREAQAILTAENKIYRTERLREGVHTKELTEALFSNPNFAKSQKITSLARDQVTGAGGALDQGLGTLVTKAHRYRDSENMLSSARVREIVDQMSDEYVNRLMINGFQGAQNKLAGIPNQGSKAMVDSFFSFNSGWDIARRVKPNGDGTFSFALDATPNNAKRLGREVTEEDLLMNPRTGRPIIVDEAGMDFIRKFQAVAQTLLRDTNAVRAARGMSPIKAKAWYTPPPNTRGKIIGFTIGPDGKTVPGGAIVAKNQEEFDALRRVKMEELDKEGLGNRFYSQAEIESTSDLWDHAEMGWVDPGFVGSKAASQTGSLAGNSMNPRAMEDALEWVADRVKANSNGVVRSLYDQQLALARARSAAETAVTGNAGRNIWDEWEATILGRPLTSVKPGAGTKAIRQLENVAQNLINSGWPLARAIGATQVAQWTNDLAHRLGVKRIKGFKSFDELAAQLGDKSPYANVTEFLQANTRVSVPPEVGAIAQGINRFSASMLLRWFEFPNAAMNMIGIVTNMPSIIRSPNTPLLGTLVGANGKKVGVVDSYKILAGGFKDMLDGAKHADWDYMVKNGDTTQSIAELNKQMSLMDSKSGFWKVMSGDKSIQVQQRIPRSIKETKEQLRHKGIDGLISLATDTTESMSRSWAHFIGLRLADANGIVGREARHSFAREVANQAIANYNPLNKPELFQTSIGSMFGLFASYMQQYNQRLFRWMETGDYMSAGRQLAMQSTLFGATSIPGYNAIESLFTGMGDNPDATITDAIYAKYGPKVGAVIAHGGIQELPKLFGLDEGIALYTRGDANFRSPSLDPTRLMAGLNIVASITDGVWEIAQKGLTPGEDLTAAFASEVIARQMPNRAMKGTLQLLANDGVELDAKGQMVSNTQTWLETGLRVLGMRSTRQQGEVEAYYANSTQRRRLAGRLETLRNDTRTAMRAGGEINYMDIFNKYVERGGSPSHFSTWIQDQIKVVGDSRGMRQFVKSLKSESSQLEAWRYEMRQ